MIQKTFLLLLLSLLPVTLLGQEKKNQYKSLNYLVHGPVQKAKSLSVYLEKFHREARKIFPWGPPHSKALEIYLVKNQKELEQKKQTSAAEPCQSKITSRTGLNHLFIAQDSPRWQFYSELFHQGAHQFLKKVLSPRPLWLEEGFAEYFGGTLVHLSRESPQFGLPRYRYLTLLSKALEEGKFPVLEEFMDLSASQFYGGPVRDLHRAFSWLLMHYLIQSKKEVLKQVFLFLRRGRPMYYNQLFGGFSSFSSGLKKYLKKLSGKRGDLDYQEGLKHYRKKDYWEAIKAFSRILQNHPYHTNARYLRALCHYHRKSQAAALKDFNFLIDIGLDGAQPYYYCALIHHSRGYRPQALEAIEKAYKLDPRNPNISNLLQKIKNNR